MRTVPEKLVDYIFEKRWSGGMVGEVKKIPVLPLGPVTCGAEG